MVIERELEFLKKTEELKLSLEACSDFDCFSCFRAIGSRQGCISQSQLAEFMKKNGVRLLSQDIEALFNRCDLDKDSQLSYSDFISATKPVQSLTCSALTPQARPVKDAGHHEGVMTTPEHKLTSLTRGSTTGSTRRSEGGSPYRDHFKESPKSTTAYSRLLGEQPSYQGYSILLSPSEHSSSSLLPSPLPFKTESTLSASQLDDEAKLMVSVFKQQIDSDAQLSQALYKLALQEDFSLEAAFEFFDKLSEGYLVLADFEETTSQLEVPTCKLELMLLMQHYDKDYDGRLNYADFCAMFTCRLPVQAQSPKSLRSFSSQTLRLLKAALSLHLKCEAEAENRRQKLHQSATLSLYSVFTALDHDEDNYLTPPDLLTAFDSLQIGVSDSDLRGLVLRYDHDEDGRVSFADFLHEVTPKLRTSPQKRY
jgi:Ca2+-binding EF-hand superfamily protein